MLKLREILTYDDVLLQPQYSEIESRSEIDLSVQIGKFKFKHPIIPANMKTIVGYDMIKFMYNTGGLSLLHRFSSIEEQCKLIKKIYNEYNDAQNYVGVSVGIKKEDYDNIKLFLDLGVKIFCIDVAHGDHKLCVDMCKYISWISPGCLLIAGNVATASGALRLWDSGATIVKIGVGSGGLCSTRIEAASGVPQFTAIVDVAEVKPKGKYFISDGGMRFAGDFAKSLCFADMTMTGGVFAGCDECPGNIISINGVAHKEFSGSSTHKTNHIEGVKAMVPVKGKAQNILTKILEGIQSACSYQGVDNLTDLKENPTFIRITNAGLIESHPHNVWKIDS